MSFVLVQQHWCNSSLTRAHTVATCTAALLSLHPHSHAGLSHVSCDGATALVEQQPNPLIYSRHPHRGVLIYTLTLRQACRLIYMSVEFQLIPLEISRGQQE